MPNGYARLGWNGSTSRAHYGVWYLYEVGSLNTPMLKKKTKVGDVYVVVVVTFILMQFFTNL